MVQTEFLVGDDDDGGQHIQNTYFVSPCVHALTSRRGTQLMGDVLDTVRYCQTPMAKCAVMYVLVRSVVR